MLLDVIFSVFHLIPNMSEICFGICKHSSKGTVSSGHVANTFHTYYLCRYPELILYITFLAQKCMHIKNR
jgi:hypothetical protein